MYEHRRQPPLPRAAFLVNNPVTPAGRLFAGCYARYAGPVFIVAATIILAPVLRRMLHLFHCDERDR